MFATSNPPEDCCGIGNCFILFKIPCDTGKKTYVEHKLQLAKNISFKYIYNIFLEPFYHGGDHI